MAKKTCLYDMHLKYQGKMVDFAGFDMPIQYEGILQEHEAVRNQMGLFDVSHMGKFTLKGPGAQATIENLITNTILNMIPGQAVYSPMCYENGGVVDDILVYYLSEDDYLLVVNASNKDKDFNWISEHLFESSKIEDITDSLCQIALQGPKAVSFFDTLLPSPIASDLKYYHFEDQVEALGTTMLVSRTGYTGEDGLELYFPATESHRIFDLLMKQGQPQGLQPCGLGARDTLRFEAAMPLYGNELGPDITPIEAGLGYFVHLDKPSFIGKEALRADKEKPKRHLVGFELVSKGIARHGDLAVDDEGNEIGLVTTGYKSPTYGVTIGLALIPSSIKIGDNLHIQVRKKTLEARVISRRFPKVFNS